MHCGLKFKNFVSNKKRKTDQLVGEYTGELITTAERVKRGKTYSKKKGFSYYIFQTCHTNLEIDAKAMGNHTRSVKNLALYILYNEIKKTYKSVN